MGDTISYDPQLLAEISTAFTKFDGVFDEAKGEIDKKVADLKFSWEGEDAQVAGEELDRITSALAAIKSNSNSYSRVVSGKAEGFGNIKF